MIGIKSLQTFIEIVRILIILDFFINLLIIVPTTLYLIGLNEFPLYLFLIIKAITIPEIMESIIDRMELTTNYWVIYDLLRLIYVILY